MKNSIIALLLTLSFSSFGFAEETLGEKATVTGKSAKRAVKKAYNRSAEALCGKLTGDNKAECLAKEAKNRLVEGKDAVVDKASEVKNNIDSDK